MFYFCVYFKLIDFYEMKFPFASILFLVMFYCQKEDFYLQQYTNNLISSYEAADNFMVKPKIFEGTLQFNNVRGLHKIYGQTHLLFKLDGTSSGSTFIDHCRNC